MGFQGGCLCGSIRYEIDRRYLNAMHCYCSMCRKAHGTAFSTHVTARPDQVAFSPSQEALRSYRSSATGFRKFCPDCGSHLLVHGQTGDETLAIPAGTLDGNPPLTILGHIFVADCVSWYTIVDELPRHERWPPGLGPAPSST